MEQFERIRRDSRGEGLSVRKLAKRHAVHRRTVRQALANAVPPPRKTPAREAPVLGRHVDLVRRWLVEDLDGAAEAAAYGPPDLAAAGRGGRRTGGRVHGAESGGAAAGRDRRRPLSGDGAADPSCRRRRRRSISASSPPRSPGR